MRKENQVDEATTDATEEDVVLQMGEAGQAYMKATGMTEDDVQQSLDEMSAALKAMPKSMDSMMMGYFIHNLLNAYGMSPEARIELLLNLIQQTETAALKVVRLREDEDGNITPVEGTEELVCDCPKCTAEREAESRAH
jgi:hypothetical protein